MTQRSIAVAFVLKATFVATATSLVVGQTWPVVRSTDRTFVFQDPDRAVANMFVLDTSGRQLYLFVWRTSEDASGPPNVIYAGVLDCRLMEAPGGEREENLLLETRNVAPCYSRGRMFTEELYGDCAVYPEYGRLRHFRLRGMSVTLSFEEVHFNGTLASGTLKLAAYKLRVTVMPDPKATRDIAESSGYLDPHRKVANRSCAVVQKGNEWK